MSSEVQISASEGDYVRERAGTELVNKTEVDDWDVDIGRADNGQSDISNTEPGEDGWLGNPYKIGEDGDREEVVEHYRHDFKRKIRRDERFRHAVEHLEGKRLACYCVPELCHGDVILQYLDESEIALLRWDNRQLRSELDEVRQELRQTQSKLEDKANEQALNEFIKFLTDGDVDFTKGATANRHLLRDWNDRVTETIDRSKRNASRLDDVYEDDRGGVASAWTATVEAASQHADMREHSLPENRVVLYKKQIAAATGRTERQALNYIEEWGESKQGCTWKPYEPPSEYNSGEAKKKRLIIDLDVWGDDSE